MMNNDSGHNDSDHNDSDHNERRSRSPGGVWSDNRYKAWYWVIGLIVVLAILLLLAY